MHSPAAVFYSYKVARDGLPLASAGYEEMNPRDHSTPIPENDPTKSEGIHNGDFGD